MFRLRLDPNSAAEPLQYLLANGQPDSATLKLVLPGKVNRMDPTNSAGVQKSSSAMSAVVPQTIAIRAERFIRHHDRRGSCSVQAARNEVERRRTEPTAGNKRGCCALIKKCHKSTVKFKDGYSIPIAILMAVGGQPATAPVLSKGTSSYTSSSRISLSFPVVVQ